MPTSYVSLEVSSADLAGVIASVRRALRTRACEKRASVSWAELEALAERVRGIEFSRARPQVARGLKILRDSWRGDARLRARVSAALALLPHRFVSYAEFGERMEVLFARFASRVRSEARTRARFVFPVAEEGKSDVWVFLSFIAHCKDREPDVYAILRERLATYKLEDLRRSGWCALYRADSCFLLLDDVSYSGSKVEDNLRTALSVSEGRFLVGLVFASPASVRRVRAFAKGYGSSVAIIKADAVESLSAADLKWLGENDAVFRNKGGKEVARLWRVLGAKAPCRTFFEHKVADSVSLPVYMSEPLVHASPAAAIVSGAAEYVADGKTHRLPAGFFPGPAERKKLAEAGWLYGAFCDGRKRSGECFKPAYKKLALPGPKT